MSGKGFQKWRESSSLFSRNTNFTAKTNPKTKKINSKKTDERIDSLVNRLPGEVRVKLKKRTEEIMKEERKEKNKEKKWVDMYNMELEIAAWSSSFLRYKPYKEEHE